MRTFEDLMESDRRRIAEGAAHYGPSWKQRGGPGAYMVGIRKWDRLVQRRTSVPSDMSWGQIIQEDRRAEGVMDDIRDLRCYLLMMLAEHRESSADLESLQYVHQVRTVQTLLPRSIGLSPEALMYTMGQVDFLARTYQWDIFVALRQEEALQVLLLSAIGDLYALDHAYGEDIADVAKGEEEMACLLMLSNGERLAFPASVFETGWVGVPTLDGDKVMIMPNAVVATLLIPRSRLDYSE